MMSLLAHRGAGSPVLEPAGRGRRAIACAPLLVGILALVAAAQPAGAAGSLTQRGPAPAPVTVSIAANLTAQAQAAAVAQQSANTLSNVANALRAMQAAQTAAQTLAQGAPSSVPNGLAPGGLVPDSGLAATGVANPVRSWINAQTPTQTTSGGHTNVSITQTAAQAILSWNDFNVGKNTTVTFNQQQSTWTALNQIAPSGVPSQILGSIKAAGQVYLINQNGIIFGGASQVNVGALIASSAVISDSQFTANGIYGTTFTPSGSNNLSYNPSFTNAGGAITVDAGAQITTAAPASVTTGGGFVMLLGTKVSNAGSITTPTGQTALAAGDNFLIRQGFNTSDNQTSTTRGNEIAVDLNTPGSSLKGGSGAVTNTGYISADTGDITLVGESVAQDGVAVSTTSVSVRGTIHLLTSASDPFGNVALGAGSLTLIEPDLASTTTALDSQRAALITASAAADQTRGSDVLGQFDDLSKLADQEQDSRVEIVSGNTVEFQGGSQTVALGGQVAASAVNRIQTDAGALVDVAGSYGVALPVSANDIAVGIQSFETRDNPQNRLTQLLRNNTVYVDQRDLTQIAAGVGGYASARDYTEGGVLEVSGYLATTGHTIGEWTAIGGNITLATGKSGAIVAQSGAVFNIDGGSIAYQPGEVRQSYFLGQDGRVYNVNTAPAYITYAGVFNGFVDNHAAWGVSQTYANVLSDPSEVEEQGYTVGRNAGSLTLDSPTSLFSATIDAGVVNGAGQTKAAPAGFNATFPLNKNDPYTLAQNIAAEPGSLVISGVNGDLQAVGDTNVSFTDGTATPADGLTASSAISADLTGTTALDATKLNQSGLGALAVFTDGPIAVAAALTLAPGATVSLEGSAVSIAAPLTARSGTVTIDDDGAVGGSLTKLGQTDPVTGTITYGDITLADGGVIDTAGLWTNLALDPNGPNDSAFINGGAVSLISATNLYDDAGSLIDASAGAVIAANGAGTGGSGGSISLTPISLTAPSQPTSEIQTGNLLLEGTLESTGFSTGGGKMPGGALTLASPTFLIAAVPDAGVPGIVTLQPGFFSAGFSSYTLIGQTALGADTIVPVVEPTEQFTPAASTVPTGGAVSAGAVLALLPVYSPNAQVSTLTQRPGASVTFTGGTTFNLGAGSAISVDPGSSIAISAYGQITIDGDLTAPSGKIGLTNDIVASNTFDNAGTGSLLSIWVGATSTISTAAISFTAANARGDSVATAPSGGSIDIAGNDADVIIQAGALLDAAGSAAVEQPATNVNPSPTLGAPAPTNAPITLEGAGGTISLASNNSLFLYGTMLAPAGGPHAAGGTLALSLNTDGYVTPQNTPDAPRILTITAADTASPLPADLTPGLADPALAQGIGQISAAQIAAGGFGTLNFYALSAFLFEGDVILRAAQSITLAEGAISEGTAGGSVTVAAPYVVLNGFSDPMINLPNQNDIAASSVLGISPVNSTGAFTVDASLIETENDVSFGGIETIPVGAGTQTADLNGFANINLDSSGGIAIRGGNLVSSGNINLTASLVYGTGTILAGFTQTAGADGNFLPGGQITINRTAGTVPVPPDEIGDSLYLDAASIIDAGVIWQPDGAILFGSARAGDSSSQEGATTPVNDPNATVALLAGSDTSVSAAGLAIPYGGTTDGVSFSVAGASITAFTNASGDRQNGAINVQALHVEIAKGATLNLSGGGTFNGAGFITGAGGSVDVLTTPLLQVSASGVSAPGLGTDQVYAIVTGPQPQVAPTTIDTQTGATGSTPLLGAQIIIPAGVPGLPAGRYTLLPASFALNAGGYRVEFDGAASLSAPAVAALPNGSYAVAGQTGIAGTSVQSALPTNFTITPAATVLNYADYDTENITTFALAKAAQFGAAQPFLPADAGTLTFNFPTLDTADITNFGTVDFSPASGGNGGTLVISGIVVAGTTTQPDFEIYGAAAPAPQTGTIALSAATIDNFDAATIEIGLAGEAADQNGANAVTLAQGAILTASRVIFTAGSGGITLQPGAEIDTLGRAGLISDSTTLGPLSDSGNTVLDVGNGYLAYENAGGGGETGSNYGPVTISAGATIYSDGSIAISTGAGAGAGVTVDPGANLGAAYLDLAVPQINIGNPALEGAASQPGLDLTQAELNTLTEGVPAAGVPATKILDLTAGQSLNFFGTPGGTTALDLSASDVTLIINTPAIYGAGTSADDVAAIKAGTIVWNGDALDEFINGTLTQTQPAPGPVLAGGPGHGLGTLDFDAGTIIFGYSSLDRPARHFTLNRLTLGFATVNLNASTEVTANNDGTLAVYQSQATYGSPGTGGALNINTPLLTGGNQSSMGFTAGDVIDISAPAGGTPATAAPAGAAGAETDLTAATISIDSAIILPSGKLDIQTTGDLSLGAAANLDLAGATSTVEGHATYGAGGSLTAESSAGNITQAQGAVIDVAAIDNNAGSIALTAMAAGQGAIALDGTLAGGSTGATPGNAGTINIRAQSLGGADPSTAFAGLNAALNSGGIFGARDFEIGEGDLTIGDGVSARSVNISLDNGNLTVTGTIDAAYGAAGSISLAASGDLTLAATAVLDAQGQTLQTDSDGQPIIAADSSRINLTTAKGEVTLDTGATLDLASADGVGRGDLQINVPRLGGNTGGDANIQADTGLNIDGASTVAVNAFATYQDTNNECTGCTASGGADSQITQAYLDGINNTDTKPFMLNAATNADLRGRVAGLSALGSTFHFRPGVEITGATPTADLTVEGDIDLSAYRYGPGVNPAIYGSGEPGVLIIRTGGNLNIYGSITDGFAPPKDDSNTPFANGWILLKGSNPYGVDEVIPVAVTLAAKTSLSQGTTVNYAVPISAGTFQAGAVAPTLLTIDDKTDGDRGAQPITQSFVATSEIKAADGTTLYTPGEVVPAFINGVQNYLPIGATIAPGGVFPFAINVGPVTWPANTPFTDLDPNYAGTGNAGVTLSAALTLAPGSLIPAGSNLIFPSGEASQGGVALRTAVDGTQGQIYPLGQVLPAGDLSWSIQLVSGANTASSDTGAVQAASALSGTGDITLADTHYFGKISAGDTLQIPAFSVIRTGTGSLSIIAGGAVSEESDYGIYTAGSSAYTAGAETGSPYNLPQGLEAPDGTLLGSTISKQLAKTQALAADYQANYTQGGGDLLFSAQGDINGFVYAQDSVSDSQGNTYPLTPTDSLLSWLSQQGGAGEATAWSVDFGALEPSLSGSGTVTVQMIGFQGIGTLGGGNLTVQSGGDATGLNLAVASTGRVSASNASLDQTGGGNLDLDIAGGLNTPSAFNATAQSAALGDTSGAVVVADLRGDTLITSGSIGFIVPQYQAGAANQPADDPRTISPLQTETQFAFDGIDLAPGDGTVTLDTRGDAVIAGVQNPGLADTDYGAVFANGAGLALPVNSTPNSLSRSGGGLTSFTLWSARTAITLSTAGGDVSLGQKNGAPTVAVDNFYPPSLSVVAQNGDIDINRNNNIELAPAANGTIDMLAGGSIYGAGSLIAVSGADPSLEPTPFNPVIQVFDPQTGAPITQTSSVSGSDLIYFGYDTPSGTTTLHPDGQAPALILAGTDIVGLTIGSYTPATTGAAAAPPLYVAALPFDIEAGRDIVAFGSYGRTQGTSEVTSQQGAPSLFLNLGANDFTTITAGRDILESSADIAGPGTLIVQAGRNIYQAADGSLESLGPVINVNAANRDGGAGITVIAGAGANGPDYAGFADLYLNPASTLPLADAADILAENDLALYDYLKSNFGYTGTLAGAYAAFQQRAPNERNAFLLSIYYAMLNQSGLEFNNPSSVRYKSYALGRNAVTTLFPSTLNGQPVTYSGDLTLFSSLITTGPEITATSTANSGIHTDFGGAIQILTPGGQTIVGVSGVSPEEGQTDDQGIAGVITQGSGAINIYALSNVLLGESRVLTTFGGDILIWSAEGNINAGIGNKTGINVPPVEILYDNYGNIVLSPTVPTTGAGIGTLNPIPQVAAGNIDLVAPLGTVDAGEAGIRVSGNLNIAAAHVENTANIQVQGSSSGVPTAPSVNVGALTTAGNSAGAAAAAAQSSGKTSAASALPSIWLVEILGYGSQGSTPEPPQKKRKAHVVELERNSFG